MPWLFYEACDAADVPQGTCRKVTVEGYPVCISQVDGVFRATGDYCPHEGVSLGEGGHLQGEWLHCGAHGWAFNVRTGACADDPGAELPRFPVGKQGSRLFVGFWSEEPSSS